MSKQSEAKEKQGYNQKAARRVCSTCGHFKSDMKNQLGYNGEPSGYMVEKNLKCGLGGFAVKKMALCNEWIEGVKNAKDI